MKEVLRPSRLARFGDFEVDLEAGELRKHGLKIRLQQQPLQILAMLLERPGRLVSREELQKQLWPDDTIVEFEHGINAAINRLREALCDSADEPRYVETLPRRGYRFIGKVEWTNHPAAQAAQTTPVAPVSVLAADVGAGPRARPSEGAHRGAPLQDHWTVVAAGGTVLAIASVLLALNVAGLRDRVMTSVGARRAVPPPKIESIAVLPLENLSRDPDQEYFADGMTDALITDLGKISALRVISRTSAMHYKGAKKRLPEIAKELNVDAVVEGTVQRSGDRVRITANLLHAPTDRHLWADSYERDLRDILVLQRDVASAIAREVRVKLSKGATHPVKSRPVNSEAYDAYLMGRHVGNDWSYEGLLKKVKYFEEAVKKDPDFAMACAALADTYLQLARREEVSSGEKLDKARALTTKALELDDTMAAAHINLANLHFYWDWNWSKAEAEFRSATELDPGSAEAHRRYANYLGWVGRAHEAAREMDRAREWDPLSVGILIDLGWELYTAGHVEDAIKLFRRIIELSPGEPDGYGCLGVAYDALGRGEEAFAAWMKKEELVGASPERMRMLREAYAAGGTKAFQKKWREEQLKQLKAKAKQQISPVEMAEVYLILGDRDEAIRLLERAYRRRSPLLFRIKGWESLRSDPRFQDLLRRMNFPP